MKKLVALLLALTLTLSNLSLITFAVESNQDLPITIDQNETDMYTAAAKLKRLGLFKGVSETDFALDRAPTRTEAVVMLIRLLGEEQNAMDNSYEHPFTDVPKWANNYVGYAYQNSITKGLSATTFGSDNLASKAMYLTFVLRALGYEEGEGKDFIWNAPTPLAKSTGILNEDITSEFLRGHVAMISFNALKATLNNSHTTLLNELADIKESIYLEAVYATDLEEYLSANAQKQIMDEYIVTVDNAEDFLEAIKSYTIIYLKAGEYNLSKVDWTTIKNDNLTFNQVFSAEGNIEVEAQIHDVKGCLIIGEDKNSTQIVTEFSYADVLSFNNTTNALIKNVTLGHKNIKGHCEGDVLQYRTSAGISIVNCNLYGCGTYGILAEDAFKAYISDNNIYSCSYGALLFNLVDNVIMLNNNIYENEEFSIFELYKCNNVFTIGTNFHNNQTASANGGYLQAPFTIDNSKNIIFKLCNIEHNFTPLSLIHSNLSENVEFDKVNFTDNVFSNFVSVTQSDVVNPDSGLLNIIINGETY